jgi:hypothetical protein
MSGPIRCHTSSHGRRPNGREAHLHDHTVGNMTGTSSMVRRSDEKWIVSGCAVIRISSEGL